MRTRLKDVAERVNLSPALVSGVLNGKANVWASEETRRRVHKAARDLGYHPSHAARALSHGRSHAVALVYRRLEGAAYRLAYTGLVDAFSAELQARGYGLLVANFGTEEEVLDHLRRLAQTHACDAVILWGREVDTEPQGALLDSLGVPFIVKGRHEACHPEWRQIDFDHEGMMARALEHVVALGHRRVAYLGFAHEDEFVAFLRRGVVEAHRRLLPEESLLTGACDDDLKSWERRVEVWLELPEDRRPTGFVIGAGNDAWHALEACLARRGHALSLAPGGPAAAGVASFGLTLTFGEALAYQDIEIDNLALRASPGLLDAVLGGESAGNVVRFLPSLSPAPTLGLALTHPIPGPDRTPLSTSVIQ